MLALAYGASPAARGEGYTLSPPAANDDVTRPAPFRKDEAKAKDEARSLPTERIFVEAVREAERRPPPRALEQKFAGAINAGNPEVAGGSIHHGAFYDGVFYWGSDPLSFVYLNVRNRLID